MEKNSHPLDSIIDFAWAAGADKFWINNAKDELKRLRSDLNKLKELFNNPVAWARVNKLGDVYGFRYTNNLYVDQETVLPLYSDRAGFKALFSNKLKPGLTTSDDKVE